MLTLDVGCGDRPQGLVNVDLNNDSNELYFKSRKINPKLISNFVKADAHYLPFKRNVFTIVYCYHTLEHLVKPDLAIKELKRVSNDTVEIRVPHKYHEQYQMFFVPERRKYIKQYHKHHYTYKTMNGYGKPRFNYYILFILKRLKTIRKTTRKFLTFLFYTFGSTFFPPIPDEIVCELKK